MTNNDEATYPARMLALNAMLKTIEWSTALTGDIENVKARLTDPTEIAQMSAEDQAEAPAFVKALDHVQSVLSGLLEDLGVDPANPVDIDLVTRVDYAKSQALMDELKKRSSLWPQ